MSRPRYSSTELGPNHPDFKASPWVQTILSLPEVEIQPEISESFKDESVTNSLFDYTLSHEHGLRARVMYRKPTSEPDAVSKYENCYFMSIGWGVDGRTGRGHGGFSSLVLDHLTGSVARRENPSATEEPPATVTMTVDYKAPVSTPSIIHCRAWPVEISGRKTWIKGVIEDEEGRPYATAKALFINLKTPFKPVKL